MGDENGQFSSLGLLWIILELSTFGEVEEGKFRTWFERGGFCSGDLLWTGVLFFILDEGAVGASCTLDEMGEFCTLDDFREFSAWDEKGEFSTVDEGSAWDERGDLGMLKSATDLSFSCTFLGGGTFLMLLLRRS